jgi:hypothetical protein
MPGGRRRRSGREHQEITSKSTRRSLPRRPSPSRRRTASPRAEYGTSEPGQGKATGSWIWRARGNHPRVGLPRGIRLARRFGAKTCTTPPASSVRPWGTGLPRRLAKGRGARRLGRAGVFLQIRRYTDGVKGRIVRALKLELGYLLSELLICSKCLRLVSMHIFPVAEPETIYS